MTSIRQAILLAADHIERNPGEFYFATYNRPDGCGTSGCALGWMQFFLGEKNGPSHTFRFFAEAHLGLSTEPLGDVCRGAVGLNFAADPNAEAAFYNRMSALHGNGAWANTAPDCAATLRKYADKYHPEKKEPLPGKGIPAEILAIFEQTVAA